MEYERPLTIEQAADYLGYSLAYFRKMISGGEIPYYKPTDGKLFFKASELCDFAYRNKRKAYYELEEEAIALTNRNTARAGRAGAAKL